MKTVFPSRTRKEAAAVCTGAELKKSQKRTVWLQLRISAGNLARSLLSTLTAADFREVKRTFWSIAGSSKPVAYLYTQRKLLGRLGAIFLVTAAIVGIATIRNTPEVSVVTAVPTKTEIPQATQAPTGEAAIAFQPITDLKIPTAPLIGDFGFSLEESAEQLIPTQPSIKTKEPLSVAKPEPIPSPAQPAVAEAPLPSPEPTAPRKEFVEIAVELKIEDGRVAQAHVANRQPGAEAFEATALQIARQRRYPPGTSRTETLVLRVANQFGRKEP